MQIVPATSLDVESTAKCFSAAFSTDPLISYFFADHPAGRDTAAERFFSILMRARIAMSMPVLVARDGDRLLGGGERLFEGVDMRTLGYECVQFVASEKATHVVLRREGRTDA